MAEAPADSIETPYNQDIVSIAQITQSVGQLRSLANHTACSIDVDPLGSPTSPGGARVTHYADKRVPFALVNFRIASWGRTRL